MATLIKIFNQIIHLIHIWLRNSLVICLCLSLCITPQIVLAANVLVYSNLGKFEIDLGNAILQVNHIDSNLALSLSPSGALNISRFHAKQATIRFKSVPAAKAQTPSNPLPAHIDFPMPVVLEQGTIDELVIVQADDTKTLQDIQFHLHANTQSLQLGLQIAKSPWGKLQTQVDMVNQKPFALQGWLAAQQVEASTPYQLRAEVSGDLAQLKLRARHHYNPQAQGFQITPATIQSNNIIAVDADISLQDAMPANLQVKLQQLNAAHLHPQLNGQLNIDLIAHGALSRLQPMQIALSSNGSQLNQHPLTLSGEAKLVDFVLSNINLQAKLANNQLQVSGGLDPTSDDQHNTLRWQANLPALEQLLTGFAGNLNMQGEISRLPDQYQYRYDLTAEKLRLPGNLLLSQVTAKGHFSNQEHAALDNNVVIQGLSQTDEDGNPLPPINAALLLSGNLARHTLKLNIDNTEASSYGLHLQAALTGGMRAEGWQGELQTLQDPEQQHLRLQQPAPMTWSPEKGFTIQTMVLQIQQGLVQLDHLHYQSASQNNRATLNSQGRITQLPLQAIQQYLALTDPAMQQNITLNGTWQIALAEQLNADISLTRASGDVVLLPNPSHSATQKIPQTMGLEALSIQLKAVNNQITAHANLQSQYAGIVQAQLGTTLTNTTNGWILSKQAPLQLQVEAHLQHINWLALQNSDIAADGQADLSLQANGTLQMPHLNGYLRGSNLSVQMPSQGLAFNDGVLNATFSEQSIHVTQLDFEGKTGTLHAQGQTNFKQQPIQLNLKVQANRFTALSRTDRSIVLSGEGDMLLNEVVASIHGQFKVHHGLVELPKAGKPTLDSDVIVLGKQSDATPPSVAIILDNFSIDFGRPPTVPYDEAQQFMLRGQGLKGALSGQIKLNGPLQQLAAFGTLEINGTYLAYGQLLDIQTGQINFSGPITNAGLNISAMRTLEDVKVGVKLTGDIKTPQLKLVADPETSNDDKLSLLVLGSPVSEAGSSDLALLSVAAGALLSQGDSVPIQSKMANLVGLDSFNIKGSDVTNYSVNVGKRVNRRLVIGYEKSLFGLLNVATLTYQLTKRIAIETKAGTENALDVVYSFNFD